MSQPDFHYADDGSITLVFREPSADWIAKNAAEAWLRARGFSVGRWQAHSPAGILFDPDVDIQKWRNLRALEREALHGIMSGDGRRGPIEIRIYADAPREAREAIVAGTPARASAGKEGLVGGVVNAAAALVVILFLGSVGYVGLYPVFAPRHPDIGKITLRVVGQGAPSVEARR